MFHALEGTAAQVFAVGGALSPRGLTAAFQDGHRFSRLIGEPGAASTFTEYYFEPVDFSLSPRPAATLLSPQPSE